MESTTGTFFETGASGGSREKRAEVCKEHPSRKRKKRLSEREKENGEKKIKELLAKKLLNLLTSNHVKDTARSRIEERSAGGPKDVYMRTQKEGEWKKNFNKGSDLVSLRRATH